jgi:hypothetical protein
MVAQLGRVGFHVGMAASEATHQVSGLGGMTGPAHQLDVERVEVGPGVHGPRAVSAGADLLRIPAQARPTAAEPLPLTDPGAVATVCALLGPLAEWGTEVVLMEPASVASKSRQVTGRVQSWGASQILAGPRRGAVAVGAGRSTTAASARREVG